LPQLLGFVHDLLRSLFDLPDAPLLGDREGVPGDADVVIGGNQGDQAEGEAANRLGDTEAIQPEGAEASLGERVR
jgi:hypothetical protein